MKHHSYHDVRSAQTNTPSFKYFKDNEDFAKLPPYKLENLLQKEFDYCTTILIQQKDLTNLLNFLHLVKNCPKIHLYQMTMSQSLVVPNVDFKFKMKLNFDSKNNNVIKVFIYIEYYNRTYILHSHSRCRNAQESEYIKLINSIQNSYLHF